jgi:hypothetical protein
MKPIKSPAAMPMAVPAVPAARPMKAAPAAPAARVVPAKTMSRRDANIVQKPHNPDNHISRMPYANGGAVKGYAKGGMVKKGSGSGR